MVKIISIILILAFLCAVYAENPGIVAVIKSSIVGKAREKYFKDFMRIMGDQEIPDMTGAGISVTNIKAKLTNLDSDNLHIFFSKSHDEVAVGLANSRLDITASWKYTKLLVEISGTAEISGPLDSFGIDLEMRKVGSDNLYIPQVIKRHFNLSLYKSLFSVKLHCSGCLAPVEATMTAFLEDTLIEEVKRNLFKQIPYRAESMINSMLLKYYPKTFKLSEDIGIATGVISEIIPEQDFLVIPIDGTIFPESEEFSRPGPTEEMPSYNPEDPGDIILLFNPYTVQTLSQTLNQKIYKFTQKIFGLNFRIILNPKRGKTEILFEKGVFSIDVTPRIVTPLLPFGIEFRAKAHLSPQILKGDSTNMMTIIPFVKKLSLKSFHLVILGIPFSLNWMRFGINILLRFGMNWLLVPSIEVPKSDLLPLHVSGSILDFEKDRAELGLVIDFEKT